MKQPTTKRQYMRLGKPITNKMGVDVPSQCSHCGDVWKQISEWWSVPKRKGSKPRLLKRRVTCYSCGKRQYGRRGQVSREPLTTQELKTLMDAVAHELVLRKVCPNCFKEYEEFCKVCNRGE